VFTIVKEREGSMKVKLLRVETAFSQCECDSLRCNHGEFIGAPCPNGTHNVYSVDGFVRLRLCKSCMNHYAIDRPDMPATPVFILTKADVVKYQISLYRAKIVLQEIGTEPDLVHANRLLKLIEILGK